MAPANVFAFVTFGALRFVIRGDGRTMGFPRGEKLVAGLASVNILVTHTYSHHLSGPLDPRN